MDPNDSDITNREIEKKNCESAEQSVEYGGHIFCGSELAYERWQKLIEEQAVKSIYERVVAEIEEDIRTSSPDTADREAWLREQAVGRVIHEIPREIAIKHKFITTFATADIVLKFVK